MWKKCSAVVAVLVIVASLGGAWPGAWAGGRNEAIHGDVNGDGYRDQVFLGIVQPDSCSVIVQYGTASGSLRPPVAYTYLRPGGTGLNTPCPDLGVAIDLNSDRIDELVIGWFAGPPPTISYNLRVLDDSFRPAFGLTQAIFQPSYLGTGDFNGDGRPDVYSVTDQGQGFETYLSLGDGTLTLGPERWCAWLGPIEYQLKDFDRDGAMDVLISYLEGCTDGASGVVVVLDDGTYQLLQHDVLAAQQWTAKVAYVNGDSIADVRTVSGTTGEVEYFIGTGRGTFAQSPTAVADGVTISGDTRTNIPVLANDYATSQARVTIVTPPSHGTARVTSSRSVVYTPGAAHPASDRFVYRLTEGGRSSTAAVNIRFTD
jgi:hypothetical protein